MVPGAPAYPQNVMFWRALPGGEAHPSCRQRLEGLWWWLPGPSGSMRVFTAICPKNWGCILSVSFWTMQAQS